MRLLLVTDYDGSWSNHVQELISITTDPQAIWGCCEGYLGPNRFRRFIRRHTVKPQAYYISFPGISVEQLRDWSRYRAESTAPPREEAPASLTSSALQLTGDLLRLPVTGTQRGGNHPAPRPFPYSAGRTPGQRHPRPGLVYLAVQPAHPQQLSRRRSSPTAQRPSIPPPTALPPPRQDEVVSYSAWEGAPVEDLVSQNQLTLVTVVEPEQLGKLQAVLEVIDLYARRLAEQGSLVGISTIHTVRWALLDGGKRLLLASNYDGTWENYIDEFAEMILSGLDAIWESSYSFPELGAQDLAAFKHFLRCHQAPANVFYSAYPSATVQNILYAIHNQPDRESTP